MIESNLPTKGTIEIFSLKKGAVRLEVKLERNTIWLTQAQMASLFETERSVITKHLKNVFLSREVSKKSNVQKMHIALSDKPVAFYGLDVVISVGYRVNSKRATQFRIWATNVLRNYLIRGYALNTTRLAGAESRFVELQRTVALLSSKSSNPQLSGKTVELLELLKDYSFALTLLNQYDNKHVPLSKSGKASFKLDYTQAVEIIAQLRDNLTRKNEAKEFFGVESSNEFAGILVGLYQTFDGKDLYFSIDEKAAHLLYFVIKDHPFVDGNKRIASVLFVYYLERNGYLFRKNGERKITDNSLVALALLVATSDPKEKELMIGIISNLLKG